MWNVLIINILYSEIGSLKFKIVMISDCGFRISEWIDNQTILKFENPKSKILKKDHFTFRNIDFDFKMYHVDNQHIPKSEIHNPKSLNVWRTGSSYVLSVYQISYVQPHEDRV
jgi:hypothetical protein